MTEEKNGAAEWLRGIVKEYKASGAQSCSAMAKMFGIDCEYETCKSCIVKLMTAIADRIDAERALPEGFEWPRFEDGELVKVGDEVELKGEAAKVLDVAFSAARFSLGVGTATTSGRVYGYLGEPVKQLTPKVLDADGVPIEVGDVVYYDGEPHPLTVVGITRDGKDALVDANGEESCVEGGRPQDFSHDAPKPVLDADGAPIEVGDAVYFVGGSGTRLSVKDIDFKPDGAFVDIIDEGRYSATVNPESLTHERPDSWERLEEDAYHLVMSEYLETPEEDVRDIVRRAKALAKAGE